VFDHRGLPRSSVWKWTYRERTPAGVAVGSAWGVFTLDNAGALAAAIIGGGGVMQSSLNGVVIAGYGNVAPFGIQITGAGAGNLWTCEVTPYA
jgi:hypothetical protein